MESISRRKFLGFGAAATAVAVGGVFSTGCSSPVGAGQQSSPTEAKEGGKTVDFSQKEAGKLKVGAGNAPIKLDTYCPIEEGDTQAGGTPDFVHSEGYYTNVREGHDLRFSIVLIDFDGHRYALTSLEHVNPVNIDADKVLVEQLTDVPPDRQWCHNPHVLSAPHDIPQEAIDVAITQACTDAVASLRDALFGFGEGITNANTNRCYETAEGWNQVSNDNGNTDHVLPVMRFDDVRGNPIAILYTVNMAAGTLENALNSEIDPAGRQITCDIAGLSERVVEEYYGGDCVAIYFAGCTGDQWGSVRAEYNYVTGSQDNLRYESGFFDTAAGFLMLDVASSRLGVSVIDTANRIETNNVHVVSYENRKFEYRQLDKDQMKAGSDPKVFQYVQSQDKPTCTTDVSVFAIDDVAVMGVKPEMNIQSLKDIRAGSPYAHNIMQNWVSFDGNSVQGYLPDQQGFDQSGKQASKTNFMPGSAEEMVGHAIELLKELYPQV